MDVLYRFGLLPGRFEIHSVYVWIVFFFFKWYTCRSWAFAAPACPHCPQRGDGRDAYEPVMLPNGSGSGTMDADSKFIDYPCDNQMIHFKYK